MEPTIIVLVGLKRWVSSDKSKSPSLSCVISGSRTRELNGENCVIANHFPPELIEVPCPQVLGGTGGERDEVDTHGRTDTSPTFPGPTQTWSRT